MELTDPDEVPPTVWEVLARVPALGDPDRLTVSALRGVQSLNNSVWTVVGPTPPGKWVLRIANSAGVSHLGVNRDDEGAAARGVAAAGIGPTIVYYDGENGHMLTPWIDIRPDWKPAQFRERRAELVELLHRLHSVAPPRGASATVFGRVEYLLDKASVLGAELPADLDARRARMHDLEDAHTIDNPGLNHNDLWANNLLDDGRRLWLVDWEFAGRGDGLYDLATISMAGEYDAADDRRLLAEYGAGSVTGLEEMKWIVRLFEAAWSSVMDRLVPAADRPFNYGAHARRMFEQCPSTP